MEDSAIAIVLAIDRCVELIVAAYRGQQELAVPHAVLRKRMDRKPRARRWRIECALARPVREIKAARLTNTGIVLGESRYDVLDVFPNAIVIAGEPLPIDRSLFLKRTLRNS